MEKSREAFRTISEVSELLDIPAHVLRFWESKFNQIKPVKRGGGRRYYRPDDINLLRGIRGLLYSDGLTIKGAQKLIKEMGVRHVVGLGKAPATATATFADAPENQVASQERAFSELAQPGLFEAEPTSVAKSTPDADNADKLAPALDAESLGNIISRLKALRDSMRT